MFEACFNLEEIKGIETLDVSNASTYAFSEMFHCCYALKSLNLSKWNTAKADNMARMFGRCKSLTYVDLSNIDISNVITMKEMFIDCPDELVIEGVSSWDLTDAF
jgi:surface protein